MESLELDFRGVGNYAIKRFFFPNILPLVERLGLGHVNLKGMDDVNKEDSNDYSIKFHGK